MKKLRWQLVIIFLTGMVVGFLLLGEQTESQAQLPQPIQGGIYSEALIGSMQRFNPILDYFNPVDQDVDRLIYSGLLRFDDRGNPYSNLAESWAVSQDGTVYNVSLRQNIKWHDGEPLTSRDVLFTIDLIRAGGDIVPQDLQAFWEDVEVIALSDTTIQFRLPESFSPFPDYLTFGILPEHLLADLTFEDMVNADFNMQPIGSGPYKFDHFVFENDQISGVILTAFDEYYGQKPFIEQIIFRYYPDGTTAYQAYQDGTVQGISGVSADILPSVLVNPNLSIYSGRLPQLYLVLFNLNNPQLSFFQDAAVRHALLLGINRQWIVDQVMEGQAIVADSVILPGTWASYDGLERVGYDADVAKNMLKTAGWVVTGETDTVRIKDNIPMRFEMMYPDEDPYRTIAETIQSNWALLGVQVTLTPLSYDEIINSRLQGRTFDAALVSLNLSTTPDPDPYPFWDQAQATGGQNYSQWNDRVASEYLEEARITLDLNERARLYRNFQVVFNDELPALPLFYPVYTYATDSSINGVRMGPLFSTSDRFSTILDWYLVTSASNSVTPTTSK
jgi:peptide/nickel transport system substrate-binding protein